MEGEPFAALLLAAAEFFNLGDAEAAVRTRNMAKLISAGWKEEVRRQGVTSVDQQALAPAFEHQEMEKALVL
jgi:hypothetical protein